MTAVKRGLCILLLIVGVVGVLGCLAAMVTTWRVSSEVDQFAVDVFAVGDETIVAVQGRVGQARERVQTAKISTADIEQSLKNWTKRAASERLTNRLGVEEKADRLATSLHQADHWLEYSESTVQLFQKSRKLARRAGAAVDPESGEELLEQISTLRTELAKATGLVESIRAKAAGEGDEKTIRDRLLQAAEIALRVIATFGTIDERLEKLDGKLTELRTEAQNLEADCHRWISIATITLTIFAVWMAAGQCFMCLYAWRGVR